MKRPLTRQGAWTLVFGYAAVVLLTLYFTPVIGDFLQRGVGLGFFIHLVYAFTLLMLFSLFYFQFRVRAPSAYTMLLGLIILFFAAFSRIPEGTDRLHFLEHGLMYVLIYLALRFQATGIVLVGRTILLCTLFAGIDEGLQGLLPNREASWGDFWTNVFSYYLAAGIVALIYAYRTDGQKVG